MLYLALIKKLDHILGSGPGSRGENITSLVVTYHSVDWKWLCMMSTSLVVEACITLWLYIYKITFIIHYENPSGWDLFWLRNVFLITTWTKRDRTRSTCRCSFSMGLSCSRLISDTSLGQTVRKDRPRHKNCPFFRDTSHCQKNLTDLRWVITEHSQGNPIINPSNKGSCFGA